MTAPVLAELMSDYPQAEVIMLTRGFYEPFFDGIPNLSIHNIDLAQYHRGFKGLVRLYRELRAAYPDIDLIIDLNDKIYSKLLRKFYRVVGVRSFHIDKGRFGKKALIRKENKVLGPLRSSVERYADVFRMAGYDLPPICSDLKTYRQVRSVPEILGAKAGGLWVGIAPFAQHKGKVYPLEKMGRIATLIVKRWPDARIFIFGGGPVEQEMADDIASRHPDHCTSVVGKFSLREEMDLMANLDLMVSMDSSAMHMASLVGLPVVSVWGATHPFAGFLGLGQSIEDAVGLESDCRPCSVYGHKECWQGDYACLNQLSPERIFDRIVRHLETEQK